MRGDDVVANGEAAVFAEEMEGSRVRLAVGIQHVGVNRVLHEGEHRVLRHGAAGSRVGYVVVGRAELAHDEPVHVVAVRYAPIGHNGIRGLRGGGGMRVEVRAHHVAPAGAVTGVEDASHNVGALLREAQLHALREAAVEELALRLKNVSAIKAVHVAHAALALAHRARSVSAHAACLVEPAARKAQLGERRALEQENVASLGHHAAVLRRVPHHLAAECGKRNSGENRRNHAQGFRLRHVHYMFPFRRRTALQP